jgi:hypothetical protein
MGMHDMSVHFADVTSGCEVVLSRLTPERNIAGL